MPATDIALSAAGPDGAGELLVRGPQLMTGYWNRPEATARALADGWLHTGDIARITDDGAIQLLDRRDDIVNRGGENVYCAEVENALAAHPAVAEVAVVGLPDDRTGERACAVIVPAGEPRPDVANLRALLQSKGVAKFKAPEQVVIWDALPKNDAGKILKHQIRAALTQEKTKVDR